jgi:hypothetical protein
MTDYEGGWYTQLRTDRAHTGTTCHYCGTARGIVYESNTPEKAYGGIVDPETHRCCEFPLPGDGPGAHAGFDPAGRRFFYERHLTEGRRGLQYLLQRDRDGTGEWLDLIGGHWPTYGSGQKSHFHPRLVLGEQWILITAGDPASQSNHLFLVDVSDLGPTDGIQL